MNETTIKRLINRQFNLIIDEQKQLKKVLKMETNDEYPEALFSGLYKKVEKHLHAIVDAQNKIVLLQNIIDPE